MTSKGEVSFDLVMDDDMSFVEGCYRISDGGWQVFIVMKSVEVSDISVKKDLVWDSGARGINIIFPESFKIDKKIVLRELSKAVGVGEWSEVIGPDSINLR